MQWLSHGEDNGHNGKWLNEQRGRGETGWGRRTVTDELADHDILWGMTHKWRSSLPTRAQKPLRHDAHPKCLIRNGMRKGNTPNGLSGWMQTVTARKNRPGGYTLGGCE